MYIKYRKVLFKQDFKYAKTMNSTIKLVGTASKNKDGSLAVFVYSKSTSVTCEIPAVGTFFVSIDLLKKFEKNIDFLKMKRIL